ncbi:MAG: Deoxyribodipyrimidine photo-lyase [Alphaproteobacteria bacterium MarineAlpha9_Bin4]|nr:deoxyribodipyrimidine photolyase [Pelagibacterales bacterium]PPR26744.1 MAG: Deoxyribodipyrimidine photo-lyase [Alphaproteobacteria bacterium MarineAlpha9_Bin4]|tara:strand:- start:31 stop:1449 length:1419 start_codon:yes stop_codon:yes gene_type:complete
MKKNCLVWFRKDLRLSDNPAINAAKNYENIYPLFIMDEDIFENKSLGGASLWWLENSLELLNRNIQNNLKILRGDSLKIIPKLCEDLEINAVFWNRCYEADRIKKDSKLKKKLLDNSIEVKSFNSSLLWEPWDIKNKSGNPYKVFTPFFKSGCLTSSNPRTPISKPDNLNFKKANSNFKEYEFKYLFKNNHWSNKFKKYWNVGEIGAKNSLNKFLKLGAKNYSIGRNYPSIENVSRLSPYLHWGEISPFEVWHEANKKMFGENKSVFLSELGWREFSYHLLYNFPNLQDQNLKNNFDSFPWIENNNLLEKWKKGETGYPIIDAGMRELWETGYMHNRVRMITSSFLVKNLLAHWKHGKMWFWNCLLDADAASNSASWQWVAGTGTDATPFFRIFNPITQSKKFDSDANYIKKYVPELSKLPTKIIFSPFEYDSSILKQYDVVLGKNYPYPIIDYVESRKRALNVYSRFINKN